MFTLLKPELPEFFNVDNKGEKSHLHLLLLIVKKTTKQYKQ